MRNPSLEVSCAANQVGLTHKVQFFMCDPAASEVKIEPASIQASRLLMRRYAAIQKAKDADVFGIVVGTLGVCKSLVGPASRLTLFQHAIYH